MRVDIQGKLRLALGTVKDHAAIGKAMIINNHEGKSFSDIEIAVLRATAHDNLPIDDKHMHQILFLVSNTPGSIPFLAEMISRRLAKTKHPLVTLKSLLLIHRILRGGNRYFEQQLRSSHISGHLQISTSLFFRNSKSSSDPYVSFLHKYSAYLEERIGWVINQAGKLEPVNVMSQGLQFRSYDDKWVDIIFHKLPKCQVFIDKVLGCSPIPPFDNLAQAAMSNTLKESFQVYMTYCEGVAALVNMFFDLTMPARALACQILQKASKQSQELQNLYENCKRVIDNKNLEYPEVQIITMDHVKALEKCSEYHSLTLECLENKPTKWRAKGGDQKDHTTDNFSLSPALFSCTMETKISKVWVVFEDEDHQENFPCQEAKS
ncbi:putative clathrin assembly protein At1g33340 [Manihot esculenta]|uniref:ENTH domain-containing protein n=1 Tax=Manihot esculenta TaxID=3983 RepID=A0A2C9VNF3_MANES|nr:putative clathrin assembly protein At1g33340 [Manihot esculenta]OAY46662.1 hypothetical protein MANES_06G017300v8 [Manihot esculenta]